MRGPALSLLALMAACDDSAPSTPPAPSLAAPPMLGGGPRDTSLAGTFYLDAGRGQRLVLTVQRDDTGRFGGTLADEDDDAAAAPLSALTVESSGAASGFDATVSLRAALGGGAWIEGHLVEGLFIGRMAEAPIAGEAPDPLTFARHVVGWKREYFDVDLFPRSFDLAVGTRRERLRIDHAPGSRAPVGTLKIFTSVGDDMSGEQLERDVEVTSWDGVTLAFVLRDDDGTPHPWRATVDGRRIRGVTDDGTAFDGARSDVLTFGQSDRTADDLTDWQERFRRQYEALLEDGHPRPASREVAVLQSGVAPLADAPLPPLRDDDPDSWPQRYTLTELSFTHRIADPRGGDPLVRRSHAWLAVPTTPPPPGGYRPVVAVNGHTGSAFACMNGQNQFFWYGDAFARRGAVVLALDISHRPVEDRDGLYPPGDLDNGDDPTHGNGSHPAIKSPGFDSDWEEDGERTWDTSRAIDFLLERADVQRAQLTVVGLSMGGEIATITGALDRRVAATVAAGFSPDFAVLSDHHNHACWEWTKANILEYVDLSDLHALIAPRALVVETGRFDYTYSFFGAPFASAKSEVRRSHAAYRSLGEGGQLVHYLHQDKHRFHVGDYDPGIAMDATGVTRLTVEAPLSPWDAQWQTDWQTLASAPTLFDQLDMLLAGR